MKKFFGIFITLSGFLVLPATAQNNSLDTLYAVADTLHEDFGLFDHDELLDISLRFDITYYKRKKPDKEYLDAILTYHTGEKDSINKSIKVRSRGLTRRTYCNFPPLLLNFRMKDSVKGEFNRIDKVKMVNQCKPGHEEYLLKEYLIYKLYNLLTDNSFRVRLLRVNYINTFRNSKPAREFAFVIEPIEFLAERTNSVEVKSVSLTQGNIKPELMDRMAIFNYMIGNTDWSIKGQHNVKILSQKKSERPDLGVVVPYDFDYSGLVNTDYSVPAEALDIKSVRDRIYQGRCRDEQVFLDALKEFSDRKEEFYKIIREFPYLGEKSKNDMISYLNEFFSKLDKRNTIIYNMLLDCRKFFYPIN
jgi:hypothetical protein